METPRSAGSGNVMVPLKLNIELTCDRGILLQEYVQKIESNGLNNNLYTSVHKIQKMDGWARNRQCTHREMLANLLQEGDAAGDP